MFKVFFESVHIIIFMNIINKYPLFQFIITHIYFKIDEWELKYFYIKIKLLSIQFSVRTVLTKYKHLFVNMNNPDCIFN